MSRAKTAGYLLGLFAIVSGACMCLVGVICVFMSLFTDDTKARGVYFLFSVPLILIGVIGLGLGFKLARPRPQMPDA